MLINPPPSPPFSLIIEKGRYPPIFHGGRKGRFVLHAGAGKGRGVVYEGRGGMGWDGRVGVLYEISLYVYEATGNPFIIVI